LEFRDGLGDIYSEVFGSGGNQDGFSEPNDFSREWGWFASLDELTNGDATKYEEVTKLPMHLCLKIMCYKIAKAKHENEQIKKQMRKNGR
jgi:hypothetical protein